jgi:hypothetical protein
MHSACTMRFYATTHRPTTKSAEAQRMGRVRSDRLHKVASGNREQVPRKPPINPVVRRRPEREHAGQAPVPIHETRRRAFKGGCTSSFDHPVVARLRRTADFNRYGAMRRCSKAATAHTARPAMPVGRT